MTGVIKSAQASKLQSVRELYAPSRGLQKRPLLDAREAQLREAESTISELRRLLEDREAALTIAQAEVADARRSGFAEGRSQGLQDAEDAIQQRFELLAVGVGGAIDVFKAEIGSLERLAPKLAQAVLAKLVQDPETRADLLVATIQRQVRTLERASAVAIDVSRADFGGSVELEALSRRLDAPELRVQVSDDVQPGGCRIKLRLGHLDVGLDQQWSELAGLLESLSEPPVRA